MFYAEEENEVLEPTSDDGSEMVLEEDSVDSLDSGSDEDENIALPVDPSL